MEIKRTERGWAGHFICAHDCWFRRNTLLEYNDIKIVVSTVGLMKTAISKDFEEIGLDRYYETMVFHAKREQDRYWDADVTRRIDFDSPWAISEVDADDKANDMHEKVVEEFIDKFNNGIDI